MTKKQFLLKMNMRLVAVPAKRRDEILNHYRSVIDQSMANGNTEASSVESLGNVNDLCKIILTKEGLSTAVPTVFTVLNIIGSVLKVLGIIALTVLLICIIWATISLGLSLLKVMTANFIPSTLLLSSNLFAAVFKLGACLIIASILIIFAVIVKASVCAAIKLIVFFTNMVKDAVYSVQSTKLMREVLKNENID